MPRKKRKTQLTSKKETVEKDSQNADCILNADKYADSNQNYLNLTATQKEEYWKKIQKWVEEEYTESTCVCLPRDLVFQHCCDYCKLKQMSPPPRNFFGKHLQKAFPRMVMRRFGQRGCSKYYYQGIDIRQESSRRKAFEKDRLVKMSHSYKKNIVNFSDSQIIS